MFGIPVSVLGKVSVPYVGLIAATVTDLVDIPELVGTAGVGGLLIATIKISFSQNKSNIEELRLIIKELREENTRLRNVGDKNDEG